MSNQSTDRSKPQIESFADQSELRGTHNFATTAQPIMRLEMPATTPPPLKKVQDEDQLLVVNEDQSLVVSNGAQLPALLADTDPLVETRRDEDDPPFRAPASWHAKPVIAHQDRYWNWSERSTAAFLGFATGVLVIVPTVFFISTSPVQHVPEVVTEATAAPIERATPPVKQAFDASSVRTASMSSGAWFDRKPVPRPVAQNEPANDSITQATVDRARTELSEGRITAARSTLRAAASPDTPQLWFVLAETYDPLLPQQTPVSLTSESLTDVDVKFARFYYNQALTHGVDEARPRLNALVGR